MNTLIKNRTIRQFVKFGTVGALGTVIDWGSFYVFNHFFGIFYLVAKILSFLLAVINSYIWNRRWTFRSENKAKTLEFSKFIVASTIGLGFNTLIFYVATQKLHWSYLLSLFLATAVVTFWNFGINKLWVFKGSEPIIIE